MRKKILIIEDDPVMGLVCQRLLAKCGFEADLVQDGDSGIERLPNLQPDAVLLDLMMPKGNGIKVLEWIRSQESFRNLPVIVLTNAAVPMLLEQAAKSGATHILDKSKFNPVVLTELLRGPWKPLAS
jgi:CheY-like chemotaxis protein